MRMLVIFMLNINNDTFIIYDNYHDIILFSCYKLLSKSSHSSMKPIA